MSVRVVIVALAVLGTAAQMTATVDPGPVTPMESIEVPAGQVIVDGDILIPAGFLEAKATYRTNLWSGGTIVYRFNPRFPGVDPTNQARMLTGMAAWEAVANITFVERSNEPNYVTIISGNGNYSAIGMAGGEQILSISFWTSPRTIMHELGHALGLWHEQQRADRNDYVQINWDNIENPGANNGNFFIRLNGGEWGPYDFESIMHYSRCTFSPCDWDCVANPSTCCDNNPTTCYTITTLPPYAEWQLVIGMQAAISRLDQYIMSFLYPESNWVFVDQAYAGTETGTFFFPFNTLTEGHQATPLGGGLWMQPGVYTVPGVFSKPMIIEAPLGEVVFYP